MMHVQEKFKSLADMIQQNLGDYFIHPKKDLGDENGKTSSGQVVNILLADNVVLICRGEGGCYEPEIVRIGLNHGKRWSQTMYNDKFMYLRSFLKQRNETSVERYVMVLKDMLEDALKCYEGPMDGEPEQYVEMMLLDSCFIIHLFCNYEMDSGDPIFSENQKKRNIIHSLQRDLIRIGNQLPFFVLDKIFNMTRIGSHDLVNLALKFFHNMVGPYDIIPYIHILNIQHLLDLVYYTFSDPRPLFCPFVMTLTELEFVDYATELHKAGVKLKKGEGNNLFDIKFKNGVMEIPPLQVADNTLYLLRNLMEYEKQFPLYSPRCINCYAKFMQCLLNSPEDAKLLRRNGIIDNQLGNDEVISNRLNQLGSEAEILGQFTYSDLVKEVNEHCRSRGTIWMASLRRNYFNSPWAYVPFFAAVVLLLLTVMQTVFSILSYYHYP